MNCQESLAGGSKPTRPAKKKKPIEVRDGNTKLRIYIGSTRKDGKAYSSYTLAYYEGGKRHRQTFADLEEAKTEAAKVASRLEQGFRDVLKLTNADQQSYVIACRELKSSGVPLLDAVRQFVAATKVLPGKASLLDAAKEYALRHGPEDIAKTVPELVAEFLKLKKQDGVSEVYLRTLRYHLAPLAEQFRSRMGNVVACDLDTWLRGLGHTPRTRKNAAVSLGTLFRFARSRGYLPKGVPTEAEGISKPKTNGGKIGILTPEQLQKVLAAADTDNRRLFLALGAFTGIRAAELARLEWKDIDLKRRHIEISADKAKTAARRLAPIPDTLFDWLRPYAGRRGKVFSSSRTAEAVTKWAGKLLGEWPNNGLRHSYISYRVAETQDVAKVALEAGNSPAMIFGHYRELVTPAEAKRWFSIKPAQAPKNVVPLSETAA